MESDTTLPDGVAMSITSNTGINFPTEQLNHADKDVLINIIKQLTTELSSVKSELADVREDISTISRRNAETRKKQDERITELEDNADTDTSNCETSGSDNDVSNSKGSDGQCTALEQVCALSEDESQEHLTANQKRSRSIAKRIDEYGKSVPAGIAITSSRMRDVLSGLEDKRIHRQTIQRVMDFLERFGDEHVNKKETRGGKTVVVFSESVVERVTSVVTQSESTTVTPTIL
jgi:DNA repair exonuclease SbcCD ATPase subunit